MEELIESLTQKAIDAGICAPWLQKIQLATSEDELIKIYFTGIKWCVKNSLFTADFVKKNFDSSILFEHSIFVDDEVLMKNCKKLVLLGSSRAGVELSDFAVSEIYVTGNSELNIEVSGHAFCMIHVFENASLKLNLSEKSSTVVFYYSGNIVELKKDESSKYKFFEKKL